MQNYYDSIEQRNCTRDLSYGNFANGNLDFDLMLASQAQWNPARSYFRMRFLLTGLNAGAPQQLTFSQGIGPAMFLPDMLWQRLSIKANDVCIEDIPDYVPQVSALQKRTVYSDAYLTSIGKDILFPQERLADRIKMFCQDSFGSGLSGQAYASNTLPSPNTGTQEDIGGLISYINSQTILNSTNATTVAIANDAPQGSTITLAGAGVWSTVVVTGSKLLITINGIRYLAIVYDRTSNLVIGVVPQLPTQAASNAFFLSSNICVVPNFDEIISFEQNEQYFECVWRPSLDIFQQDMFLPGGKYQITFQPYSADQYQKMAIESLTNVFPTVNSTWQFRVVSMYFHPYIRTGIVHPSGDVKIPLYCIRGKSQNITSSSLNTKNFEVMTHSDKVTIAFQDGNVNSDSTLSIGKFKIANSEEQNLTQYYIKRGGLTLPQPIPSDIDYNSVPANTDYIARQYYDMLSYSEPFNFVREGGIESKKKWLDRGLFLSQKFPMSRDLMCEVSVAFSSLTSSTNNLLFFDHYHSVVEMKVENGVIVNVRVEK